MGRAKAAMMEHHDNLAQATDLLVALGTLRTCEVHGYVYEGDGDLDRLWPMAMGERKKGANGRAPWAKGMKGRAFTDLLKQAFDDNSGGACYGCQRNSDRD